LTFLNTGFLKISVFAIFFYSFGKNERKRKWGLNDFQEEFRLFPDDSSAIIIQSLFHQRNSI